MLFEAERRAFNPKSYIVASSARVVDALRVAGVPCVTLKGPALAARFWGDVTQRPSTDIDLLVARRDYAGAQAVLRRLGYERSNPYPDWYLRGWHYNLGYVSTGAPPEDRAALELRASNLGRPDIEAIVGHPDEVPCDGWSLPAPSAPIQLVAASAHLLFHEMSLRQLLDVAFIAAALSPRQWDEAIAVARRAYLDRACTTACKPQPTRSAGRRPQECSACGRRACGAALLRRTFRPSRRSSE